MSIIRCPDCGSPVSTRFPMHNCTPEGDKRRADEEREHQKKVAISEARAYLNKIEASVNIPEAERIAWHDLKEVARVMEKV